MNEWHDCYGDSWKGTITDDSFAHPAKFSKALIERIFDHCLQRGWLKRGDVVGDCFGGIGNGGIVAAYRGIAWVGVELEPRFVKFAQDNFALHAEHWEQLGLPQPRIFQGDSRKFHEAVQCVGVVTSPPYSGQDQVIHGNHSLHLDKFKDPKRVGVTSHAIGKNEMKDYGTAPGQIGRLKIGDVDAVITSPPYAEGLANASEYKDPEKAKQDSERDIMKGKAGKCCDVQYGLTNGQIGRLKSGSVDAVVTSPPYAHIAAGAGGLNTKPAKHAGQQSGRNGESASQTADQRYGQSPGQIAGLNDGDLDAVVTSPPFTQGYKGGGGINKNGYGDGSDKVGDRSYQGTGADRAEGNIENLQAGTVDGVVTSPPFEKTLDRGVVNAAERRTLARENGISNAEYVSPIDMEKIGKRSQPDYGATEGQIGNEQKETYWTAMKAVYSSCFIAIKPGGICAIVVKDYVQNKKIVPLCDDTARLLEHCGFQIVERVHAMLTKETRHNDLFNGETVTTKSRKSFFRRLAEKKGSPKIDWEEVIFCIRP